MTKSITILLFVFVLGSIPIAFADSELDAKLEFAGTLEEALGHFWALEQNLDEENADLALVHATHPISELYETMSLHLEDNPEFDEKLQDTLLNLQHKANADVARDDAQAAIEDAKEIIQEARMLVVGAELSNDTSFKAQLINGLLETSKVEYREAVSDGIIQEMAEFQDGSAFVWRSQQILDSMQGVIDLEAENAIRENFENLSVGYAQRASPAEIEVLTDSIISDFEQISGVESTESEHMEEAFGPLSPLQQVKSGKMSSEVECKTGLILVLNNYDQRPACVSMSGADKLEDLGWGTRA